MTPDELDEAWHVLSMTEKTVLKQRFGLNGDKPRTLAQVGRTLGVSVECVRQQQNTAISKLRRYGIKQETETVPAPAPLPPGKVKYGKWHKVPRKKRRRKPKPVPRFKPPPRSDSERLDWLEKWIWGAAMTIRKDYEGGLSLYRGNDSQLSGENLRELLDLVLHEKVPPINS